MRILIVDDESLERMGIKKCLMDDDESKYEIEEAENGRVAIMKAETFRPDLIFMDVKMPGINGIVAAEEILKINTHTKFVILSAYDTFEYARQAMELGIKHYLLKPSSEEDVLEVVEKISNEIKKERSKRNEAILLRDQYERALSVVEGKIIDQIMNGENWEPSEVTNDYLRELEKPSRVIMMDWKTEDDDQQIESYIYSYLEQRFSSVYRGSFKQNRLPLLVQVDDKHISPSLYELIRDSSKQYPNTRIRIGIGKSYNERSQFSRSYQEALFALYAFEETGEQICFYEKVQQQKQQTTSYSYSLEDKLIDTIVSGEKEQFLSVYKRYMFMLEHHSKTSPNQKQKHINEMFIVLKREWQKMYPEERLPEYLNVDMALLPSEEMQKILFQLTVSIYQLQEHLYQDRIETAQKYIQTHYHKQLTLENVSEYVQLSPHYFSKLFKTKMNQSFIEYVTEVRMNKAKEQLTKPDANIKAICFDIGYKDPNYFSRVFKRMTGFTPTEYKDYVKKSKI